MILRVFVIVLCLYIQTSRINSTSLSKEVYKKNISSEVQSTYYTENSQGNHFAENNRILSNETDNEKRRPEKWDCFNDEMEKQQALITTNGMLNQGDVIINKHINDTENTILVLGNAGAGKTTFVQFMAGDNNKLLSREIIKDSGEFVIEDGLKIGTSPTESFTLYPEQSIIDNNTSFTDTPGFSDTRSPKYEIVTSYVMKKYLKNIKNIKIVLLVVYNSVQLGVYKDDFINLLRNINNFINNINNYKDSIVLIATKVPYTYKNTKHNISLISDDKIILNIGEFINKVQVSLEDKLKNTEEETETEFLNNAINIVTCLQEQDDNGKLKKINIFRRPTESGPLSTIPDYLSGKKSLTKTIGNIKYVKLSENDIGYTLSYRAKNFLNCLLYYINENIARTSDYFFHSMKNYYEGKLQNFTDVYKVNSDLETLSIKLKQLKEVLKQSKNDFKNYINVLNNFITTEDIHLDKMENITFLEIYEHVNILEQFTESTSVILTSLEWVEKMDVLLNFIKENESWYNLLTKLFKHFSSYDIQNSTDLFPLSTLNTQNINEVIELILSHFDMKLYQNLNSLLSLNDYKKTQLENVVALTLNKSLNITCDKGKLILTGFYIKLSEINDDLLKNHCGKNSVKFIGINAIHTVFIDIDLIDNSLKGINIMIAAPTWEIIGKRKISIDGPSGINHNNSKAANGNDSLTLKSSEAKNGFPNLEDRIQLGENSVDTIDGSSSENRMISNEKRADLKSEFAIDGKDGKPGFPGGNGGHFLGIGLSFINEGSLTITSNGGLGGPGQDGGNGGKGTPGKNGSEKFFQDSLDSSNYTKLWKRGNRQSPSKNPDFYEQIKTDMVYKQCRATMSIYSESGDCGEKGGQGGNGGRGGFGGKSGRILLMGENKPPSFLLNMLPGHIGQPGKGGDAGPNGDSGKKTLCIKTYVQNTDYCNNNHYGSNYENCPGLEYWNCMDVDSNNNSCQKYSSDIKTGLSNFSTVGILQPPPLQVYDFSEDLYTYTTLLKQNENNIFLSKDLIKFQDNIYKIISTKKNDFWRFFVLPEISTKK